MPEQLSFAAIFEQAAFERKTSHFPTEIQEGIVVYRELIERYNRVIFASDLPAAAILIADAHDLAIKLNGGDPGIFADEDSPGNVLERETAAQPGTMPIWGQTGVFVIEPRQDLKVRIEMEGMFGLPRAPVPSFAAHAVDPDKPFLSETGYRSFTGCRFSLRPGMRPGDYAKAGIEEHIKKDLKGKLHAIENSYRERIRESMQAEGAHQLFPREQGCVLELPRHQEYLEADHNHGP